MSSVSTPATGARAAVDWRRIAILVLCIAGIGVAGYLTYVKVFGAEVLCLGGGGGVSGCKTVENSRYAEWVISAGGTPVSIPTAALGLGMYLALTALAAAALALPGRRVLADQAVLGISFAGLLYSIYLTYLELFVIFAICQWCVASAVIVTAVCVLAFLVVGSDSAEDEPDGD